MDYTIDPEFVELCKKIIAENKREDEWAEIESDDMIQEGKYEGGYDADEMAFCFSVDLENDDEYWFQVTLDEVGKIASGALTKLSIRPAE